MTCFIMLVAFLIRSLTFMSCCMELLFYVVLWGRSEVGLREWKEPQVETPECVEQIKLLYLYLRKTAVTWILVQELLPTCDFELGLSKMKCLLPDVYSLYFREPHVLVVAVLDNIGPGPFHHCGRFSREVRL